MSRAAWRGALPAAALGLLALLAGRADSQGAGSRALVASCPDSLVAGGHDYHGLTLTMCNFSGLDLSHANFQGATLKAVAFIRTRLIGADFSGATIVDSGDAVFVTDFSFATLDQARFVGTTFTGTTYFSYASLSCADFSDTVLDNGNAVFGDSGLAFDTRQCRPRFVGAKMNCEFFAQWPLLDLSQADVSACKARFQPGQDFSGAMLAGVVFDGLDLSRTRWSGALLERASFQGATLDGATGLNGSAQQPSRLSGARFDHASLRGVDLSHAQLYGANFTQADLSHSSLAASFLGSNPAAVPPIVGAAVFDGAHLRNVNLAHADLSGASFRYASFYGSFNGGSPTLPCPTDTSRCSPTGFTCACATASGATLSNTDFSNAFLFGVDFSGSNTTVNGTRFGSAILVGASFAQAEFRVDSGAAPTFAGALLAGTQFGGANLAGVTMTGAFLDFGAATNPGSGNLLYLQLSAAYTRFRGWSGAAAPCVLTSYAAFSTVPANTSLTCPDGSSGLCGAARPGPPPRGNPNWNAGIAIGSNTPVPGWYGFDATYDLAPVNSRAVCNGQGPRVEPGW